MVEYRGGAWEVSRIWTEAKFAERHGACATKKWKMRWFVLNKEVVSGWALTAKENDEWRDVERKTGVISPQIGGSGLWLSRRS